MSYCVGREGWIGSDPPDALMALPVKDDLVPGDELTNLPQCTFSLADPVDMAGQQCDTGFTRRWGLVVPSNVMDVWRDSELSISGAFCQDRGRHVKSGDRNSGYLSLHGWGERYERHRPGHRPGDRGKVSRSYVVLAGEAADLGGLRVVNPLIAEDATDSDSQHSPEGEESESSPPTDNKAISAMASIGRLLIQPHWCDHTTSHAYAESPHSQGHQVQDLRSQDRWEELEKLTMAVSRDRCQA
jgi:hypothetical protein